MRFAMIVDSVVINVIVVNDDDIPLLISMYPGIALVSCDDTVNRGDTYSNGIFTRS